MYELASAFQRQHVGDLSVFGTVGDWQGSGSVAAGGMAWEWHGMCELALSDKESAVSVKVGCCCVNKSRGFPHWPR
jgi:hypothetical protein